MIDEKKLIEETQKYFVNNSIHKNDLAEVIANLPKIGDWIPCGKEKPRGGENIATVKWYDGTIEVIHAYYNGFGWITGCGERAEVIAWMEFPEPYKEDAEK